MRLYHPVQKTHKGGALLLPKRTPNGLVMLNRKHGGTLLLSKNLGGFGLKTPRVSSIPSAALTKKLGSLSLSSAPRRKNISFMV